MGECGGRQKKNKTEKEMSFVENLAVHRGLFLTFRLTSASLNHANTPDSI